MAGNGSRVPARLNVILARDAPVGIVFRRGPSRQVQVIKWHTDTDRFEPGQWFKGRIYSYRADVSPDGRYMAYFAAKHKQLYSWTAISRPPYLTALALWPKGDCWDGGALFENPTTLWLNHPREQAALTAESTLPPGFKVRAERGGGEDGPIWFQRLAWNGWEVLSPGDIEWQGIMPGFRTYTPMVWRRRWPQHSAAGSPGAPFAELRMRISRRGYRRILEFAVMTTDDRRIPIEAHWADWDQSGRLVLSRAGAIRAIEPHPDGTWQDRLIADFNENRFEPVVAPDWAREW